jgi:uncharacterized iron-regulated membrane protein
MALVDEPSTTDPTPTPPPDDSSRLWRSLWRTHFYAGIFAMPVLVLLAVTGLGILYTDVINDWQYGDLHQAKTTAQVVSLDDQRQTVVDTYRDWSVDSVTPPKEPGLTTTFAISKDDGATTRNVYVDPSDGQVVGDQDPGAGIVGLSNRLHGTLNNDGVTVPMPTLSGLFGDDPTFADIPLGDVLIEIIAIWVMVLAATGLYLWWPRKRGTGKALFVPRLGKKGRARWRDLHAIPGVVLSVMLLFFAFTGMPWSDWWGSNWSFTASKVTPNQEDFWSMDAPSSDVPKLGTVDRLGNRIPWATREDSIPSSSSAGSMPGMDMGEGGGGGTVESVPTDTPVQVSLAAVAKAAADEGMLAGYTINLPVNDTSGDEPSFGSFMVVNPWPSQIQHQGAIFVNQFTGRTIARSDASKWGTLQQATELGVQTHMGTQFGLASRIVMTVSCLLVIWSAFSGLVMWWKRRRTGLGFPRRPIDASLQRVMIVIAVVLALLYPLWGLSVIALLLLDKFVVRKVPPLRRAFGMKDV